MRLLIARDRESPVPVLDEFVQRARAPAKVVHFQERERHVVDAGGAGRVLHVHDPVSVRVGQRREQHPVYDAEDRGVEADPQSQGQNESGGVSGRPDKASNGLAQAGHG